MISPVDHVLVYRAKDPLADEEGLGAHGVEVEGEPDDAGGAEDEQAPDADDLDM